MYDFVHKLLKKKKYKQVLSTVLENEEVREPFTNDLNHAWYIVGDAYFKLNDYKLAIQSFKKALEYWDEDISAMIALSNSYSELKAPELASKVLENGLRVDPFNETLNYNLGNAYFDQERYQDASSCYKKIDQSSNLFDMAQNNLKAIKYKLNEG